MERAGYHPGSSSGSSVVGAYQNEQPATAPHVYYGAPPPDMQQCYQSQPAGFHMPFPNDPYFAWNQQNQAWLAQMQQHQLSPHPGYLPPPPPPPPASILLGRANLAPPPPPPNLDAILGGMDEEEMEKKPETFSRRLTTSDSNTRDAPEASSSQQQQTSATATTLSLSSTSTIPSLLDGLRADVAKSDRERTRTVPDLKSIEHAASILSSRTGKSPKSRRDEERKSRRAEERSDSRKENRAEPATRDKRRDGRRREEGERERDRLRSSKSSTSRSRDSATTRGRESRSDRERRRNGDRKDKEKEKERKTRRKEREKPAKDSAEALQPSDIQLNVREGARAEGGVQVYLHSDDEHGEEGEEEYDEDEEEEEEGVAESDMDIETEADNTDDLEGSSSSFYLQQLQQQTLLHGSHDWGSGCAPEDEYEHRLTPVAFAASGPPRRVNNPMYRESHKRARALASQALSEDYRERYDLISKHLRSRCIFKGLESSCGPDAPRLTINDPRPQSKYVQTFPSKESNVQYYGPDSFVAPSAYKKNAPGGSSYAVAPPGSFTFVSRSKLVRAPPVAPSTKSAFSSLKRTIQNGAATTMTKAASLSTTSVSSASSSTTSAPDGPRPAKMSKVDELMASLLTMSASSPSETRHATSADEAPPDGGVAAAMRKTVSEPRVDVVGTRTKSEEPSRPSPSLPAFAAHSPRAERATLPHAATAQLPPRSALSFRKIGEHVVRPGSKLCFEWAESGACKAGVFCNFEHGEGAEAVEKSVCSRMLRGLCRGDASCPLPHGLLPHQMPICEHYLRMQCNHGPEECGLVHIKHNAKVPVCVFFNQGKCTKEDDCTFRHQYRSDVVRALGVHAPSRTEQHGHRMPPRLPKGRALLTAAVAAPSTRSSSATSSPARPATAAAADVQEPDTSTFAWIE